MKKRHQDEIQKQVNRTLEAFQKDKPPEMDPWFYEHLQNRIEAEQANEAPAIETWWNRALKPGLLVGLAAVNVIMMIWIATPTDTSANTQTSYIESLSSQYGLNYADTYLMNNTGE